MGLSDPVILAGIIVTCIIINLMIFSLRRTRAVLAACLFFWIALLPAMGIVRFARMIAGDRYVYLPSIGLLMLLASVLGLLWHTAGKSKSAVMRPAVMTIVLMLASAEAIATRKYLAYWSDSVTLYKRMLVLAPRMVLLNNDLGIALLSQGRLDEAADQFEKVLKVAPRHVRAHVNLANLLLTDEKFDEAISHYNQALQTEPDYPEAHYHLAVVQMRMGRLDEALLHFREAIRLTKNPPWYFLHGLAWILAAHPDPQVRDANEAIQLAKQAQALTLTPRDDMRVLDTLAAAYAATGRFDLAVSNVKKALALASPNPHAGLTKQVRERLELYKHEKSYTLDLSKPGPQPPPNTLKTGE